MHPLNDEVGGWSCSLRTAARPYPRPSRRPLTAVLVDPETRTARLLNVPDTAAGRAAVLGGAPVALDQGGGFRLYGHAPAATTPAAGFRFTLLDQTMLLRGRVLVTGLRGQDLHWSVAQPLLTSVKFK